MAQIEESWQPVAETLGYRDEQEMLKHLYNEQGFSLSQIAKIVGYSVWSVRRRLVMAGVVMRNRGGANNRMGRKLAGVPDEEIFGGTYEAVAQKFGVHTASVYLERQRRRRTRHESKDHSSQGHSSPHGELGYTSNDDERSSRSDSSNDGRSRSSTMADRGIVESNFTKGDLADEGKIRPTEADHNGQQGRFGQQGGPTEPGGPADAPGPRPQGGGQPTDVCVQGHGEDEEAVENGE